MITLAILSVAIGVGAKTNDNGTTLKNATVAMLVFPLMKIVVLFCFLPENWKAYNYSIMRIRFTL